MINSVLARVPMAAKLGVLVATALLAAACSSGGSSSSTSSSPPAASGTATASATAITTKPGSAGPYLTDGSGRAMYMWMKDSLNSSACTGACASAWPPVPATGTPTASGGAVSSDLGSITRADGSRQLTYKGHALYYFSGDTSAGMTSGQGLNAFGGKWWLVSPSGTSITAIEKTTTPSSSPSSSSGYGGGGY